MKPPPPMLPAVGIASRPSQTRSRPRRPPRCRPLPGSRRRGRTRCPTTTRPGRSSRRRRGRPAAGPETPRRPARATSTSRSEKSPGFRRQGIRASFKTSGFVLAGISPQGPERPDTISGTFYHWRFVYESPAHVRRAARSSSLSSRSRRRSRRAERCQARRSISMTCCVPRDGADAALAERAVAGVSAVAAPRRHRAHPSRDAGRQGDEVPGRQGRRRSDVLGRLELGGHHDFADAARGAGQHAARRRDRIRTA